jgi:hypothetical protein
LGRALRHQEAAETESGDSDLDQERPQPYFCLRIASSHGCGDLETASRHPRRLFEAVSRIWTATESDANSATHYFDASSRNRKLRRWRTPTHIGHVPLVAADRHTAARWTGWRSQSVRDARVGVFMTPPVSPCVTVVSGLTMSLAKSQSIGRYPVRQEPVDGSDASVGATPEQPTRIAPNGPSMLATPAGDGQN